MQFKLDLIIINIIIRASDGSMILLKIKSGLDKKRQDREELLMVKASKANEAIEAFTRKSLSVWFEIQR